MAVALEVRVPILDHRIVEFLAPPARFKMRAGKGKWLLRQCSIAMCQGNLERLKSGFAIPLGTWPGDRCAPGEELPSERA
jgi:asparagine synthase (glutamine-hydrolysing)